MAREWAEIPEYAASLERALGPGATDDFVTRIEERSAEMLTHGRMLFERWVDMVVEAPLVRLESSPGR